MPAPPLPRPIRFERANPGPLLSVSEPQRLGYAAFEIEWWPYQVFSNTTWGEKLLQVEPRCEVLILLSRSIHSAPRVDIRRFG